jgi:hypothetical protein
LVEGAVGFAVGGVEFRVRPTGLIGSVVKEAVGERTADALMEEHEEQSGPGSVVGEAIGIAPTVTFEQAVGFDLAQVIA